MNKAAAEREKRRLRAELARLKQQARPFTPESFCTTAAGVVHVQQLAFVRAMLSGEGRILAACTPRAGKTRPVLFALARLAMDRPETTSLYLAITEKQAKRIAWRPFKKMRRDYNLPCELSETDMSARFENGSVIYFSGADDQAQIDVWLGESFAGGLVVLDECAKRPDAVLVPLIEDVIEDRLTDVTEEHPEPGRLVAISSLPPNAGGWFWRQVTDLLQPWSRFSWSRLDNPFLKDQQRELDKLLAAKGLTVDDEVIQRNWYARPVWTTHGGRPYRYERVRNGYVPERPSWADEILVRSGRVLAAVPWTGVTHAIAAIDLGGADRASLQVIGYGKNVQPPPGVFDGRAPAVQHLFDWASDRDQHFSWGELMALLGAARAGFANLRWHAPVYDAEASKTEHDTLGRDYGIALIAAANKSELRAQVNRLSDLQLRALVAVMIGSAAEDDFTRAQWDQRELAKGRWKLAIGPAKVDASEAFRYAVAEWHAPQHAPVEMHPPRPVEHLAAMEMERRVEQDEVEKLYRRPPPRRTGTDPQLDRLLGQRWQPGDPDV